jgi:hypothetical protein
MGRYTLEFALPFGATPEVRESPSSWIRYRADPQGR